MAPLYEKPLKRLKKDRPSRRREAVSRKVAADARAERRYAMAVFVRRHGGSVREAELALAAALLDGSLAMAPLPAGQSIEDIIPSRSTVHRWLQREHEEVSITALRDKPRHGRTRSAMHPDLENLFLHEVMSGRVPGPADLHREMEKQAKALGVEAPSFAVVRARLADVPHLLRTIARHGKKAGIADGIVHGAVPAEMPHSVWSLDELDSKAWVKVWSDEHKQLVAVKAAACTIIDNCSGVVVSYFIAHPLRRSALRGFDRWDVKAAVAGACFPEFAPSACAAYAGYLPRAVRLDKHAAHGEIRTMLTKLGVELPNLAGYAPWARGAVENTIALLKSGMRRIRGYDATTDVAEYVDQGNAEALRIAAGTTTRETVRLPMATEHLLNLDEFAAEFDKVVAEINTERVHAEWKMPRAARYALMLKPGALRSGREALSLLTPTNLTVQKDGIVVDHVAYAAVDPTMMPLVNEKVDVRLDPAMRGLFVVEKDGAMTLCQPAHLVASSRNPGAFSKAVYATVCWADELARLCKAQYRAAEIGAEAAEESDGIAREKLGMESAISASYRAVRKPRSRKPKAPSVPAPTDIPGVIPFPQARAHGEPALPRRGIAHGWD
jgi:transposase InsO family protein